MAEFKIEPAHLEQLRSAIKRLNETKPLSLAEQKVLEDKDNAYRDLVLSDGQATLGKVGGSDVLYQLPEAEFKAQLRSKQNDLGEMLRLFNSFLDSWFSTARMAVPPYYPDRIAVILRKAKCFELEKVFLAAYFRHFWFEQGSAKDQALGERAKKIGVSIPAIPSASPWYGPEERRWAAALKIKNLSIDVISNPTSGARKRVVDFKFYCLQCGGTILDVADPEDAQCRAQCKRCGIVFGSLGRIQDWAGKIADKYTKLLAL